MTRLPLDALRAFLDAAGPGYVRDQAGVAHLIADTWDALIDAGESDNSMAAHKLTAKRVERAEWQPPVLSFDIERHGATVMGSSRADVQKWEIDVGKGTRRLCGVRRRQLRPTSPKYGPAADVSELVRAILAHQADSRLTWSKSFARATVVLNQVLPATGPQSTQQGRSRRLRRRLTEELERQGWRALQGNRCTFEAPLARPESR